MSLFAYLKSLATEARLYFSNHIVLHVPSHHLRLFYYRQVMGFDIGRNCAIFMGSAFDATRGFKLGTNSVINERCRIDTRGGVTIGENVSISADVIILTGFHDLDSPGFTGGTKKVVIEDRVWVGTRAMILPGVTLGEGCVVAAGAVVTSDVPPFFVVAGVPAKKIKERSRHLVYETSYRRYFH